MEPARATSTGYTHDCTMVQISLKHIPIQNQWQLGKNYPRWPHSGGWGGILYLSLASNVNTMIYKPPETELYLHLTEKGLALVV